MAEAVSPDGGTVYVLNAGSDNITPVDALNTQGETPIALPSGYNPVAFAISPNGQDAWVASDPASGSTSIPAELVEVVLTGASPGTIAQEIQMPDGSSVAAVAITPDGLEALVAAYNQGSVIPVDLATDRVLTPIDVGLSSGVSGVDPTSISVSPNGQDAYVADSGDGSLSQINLANNSVTAVPLETGFSPEQVAVSPDGSTAWVTEDSAISPTSAGFVVPVAIPSMSAASPIGVGLNPQGIAVSPDGSTVYVADETIAANGTARSEGSISVISTAGSVSPQTQYVSSDPSAVVVTPDEAPVASFTDTVAPAGQYTTFDASGSYSLTSGGLTYSWNFGDGSAVTTPSSNPTIDHIYRLPGTYTATLSVIDASGTSTEVVYTGQYVLDNGGPSAGQTATFTVPGATVNREPIAYVADSGSNQVTPILADPLQAGAANTAGTPISVGTFPDAIAITPNGSTAYVVNSGSNNVTPINTATDTVAAPGAWIGVGSEPDAIAITPNGSTAYVVNSGSGTVSKIALSTGQVTSTITVHGSPTRSPSPPMARPPMSPTSLPGGRTT